jgi:hypothetical protein
MATSAYGQSLARALVAIIARLALFFVVVALVWIAFVWLYAVHPDTLGWVYAQLRPITIWLYGLIDNQLPDTVKYKVSAGLSDELGPRALFLLVLGALSEVVVLTIWHGLRWAIRLSRRPTPARPAVTARRR